MCWKTLSISCSMRLAQCIILWIDIAGCHNTNTWGTMYFQMAANTVNKQRKVCHVIFDNLSSASIPEKTFPFVLHPPITPVQLFPWMMREIKLLGQRAHPLGRPETEQWYVHDLFSFADSSSSEFSDTSKANTNIELAHFTVSHCWT